MHYRAVPESGNWRVLPALAWSVKNCVIPVESFVRAAVRLPLMGVLFCGFVQRLGYYMLWVPELSRPQVGDSRERAFAWWAPVRRKNRLPNDEHA